MNDEKLISISLTKHIATLNGEVKNEVWRGKVRECSFIKHSNGMRNVCETQRAEISVRHRAHLPVMQYCFKAKECAKIKIKLKTKKIERQKDETKRQEASAPTNNNNNIIKKACAWRTTQELNKTKKTNVVKHVVSLDSLGECVTHGAQQFSRPFHSRHIAPNV